MSIKEDWEKLEQEIIPRDAGPGQRDDMRRAFYCGAWAVFAYILNDGASDPLAREMIEFFTKTQTEALTELNEMKVGKKPQ